MGVTGSFKRVSLLLAMGLALLCMNVPANAKTSGKATSQKQTTAKEEVQKDSAKETKKDSKKKASAKTSTKTSAKKETAKKETAKKESGKKESAKKETSKKDSKKTAKDSSKKDPKAAKKDSKKDKKDKKSKKKNPPKHIRTGKAELVDDNFDPEAIAAEEAQDSSKVTIEADDPKAFTKALLYEKEGVDFEVVNTNEGKETNLAQQDSAFLPSVDYFDFSDMLIPVTHEALLGSPYGVRSHRLHRGVDVNVIMKEPIVAAYPGTVIMSKYNKGGYGHYVLVEHENGLQTLYGHLAKRTVKVGDYVYPGDIVGLAGNTGRSSGAHLHFEIRYGEVNIDPATVVNFPKWELQPGVDKLSKKKVYDEHRKMQAKVKKENTYVVKNGDTLTDVALWFNISEEAVIRINNLPLDKPIKVGQVLRGCK
ncbi:LysM domain-containing protein [Fibrobacter sp. UWEL]|nr:LysM domain-containing protein [Fibrobacter sp. UWEL]